MRMLSTKPPATHFIQGFLTFDISCSSHKVPRVMCRDTSPDRKSTRLNSSHVRISYAVFCLKKKNTWPYGYSMPIAVCYSQVAFSRSGLFWYANAQGEPVKATSYMAVGLYVANNVIQLYDMD